MKTTEQEVGLLIENNISKESVFQSSEDGEINWNWTAVKINDFIREQTQSEKGAFSYFHSQKFTIWTSRLTEEIKKHYHPGTLLPFEYDLDDSEFRVVCGDGVVLELFNLEMEGDLIEPLELCCRLTEKKSSVNSMFDRVLAGV